VLQHAITFSHPNSNLPKISPCSPGTIGGWPLGYEERKCWANCPSISFQDFNLCGPECSTNVTDRQTDGQTTCDLKTALCTAVHRTVKRILGIHLAGRNKFRVFHLINLQNYLFIFHFWSLPSARKIWRRLPKNKTDELSQRRPHGCTEVLRILTTHPATFP